MNAMHLIRQHPPATGITLMQYGMQCIHANRQAMRHCHIPTDALPCDETKKIQTEMKQIIHSKFKPMKKEPLFVALSNQKGGVGKSTFTVLLASYFHYLNGYNVLVVDCDYPQHSISAMRDWEVGNIEKNVHLQNLLVEQFGTSGRKAYSILNSTPEEARETAGRFLEKSELDYDLVLFDLPGTVNVPGVFQSVINMDYVFTPITQERMVMRSSMSFVLAIREYMHRHADVPLRGIHMFWNRMDKRVSKGLYNGYTEIFRSLKLPVLETVIPSAERYNKDSGMKGPLFRSTLFPPSPSAVKGSGLDLLVAEIETVLKLK